MTDERNNAGELTVRLVRADEVAWYNALMKQHHSLGAAASGRVLRYVAEAAGEPLVLGTFGSAAWGSRSPTGTSGAMTGSGPPGWSGCARTSGSCCRRRAGGAPCPLAGAGRDAASAARRLPFGVRGAADGGGVVHRPAAHAGTVYAACGFTPARLTAGYGRSRGRDYYAYHGQPKQLWLRELAPGGIAALAAGFDAPVLAGRRAPDFNRLRVSGERGLLEHLARVTDHRKPKGVRHDLAAILVVVVVARLCGADSVYAAARFAQSMPQEALRRCGIRYNTRLGLHVAQPQDDQADDPQDRRRGRRPADVRLAAGQGSRRAAELAAHRHRRQDRPRRRPARRHRPTFAAFDVTAGTVLGQADVETKTNEITCFVPSCKPSSTAATAGPVAAATTRLAAATATGHRRETPQEEQEEEEEEKKKKSWSS